jgi:hypothetical protein
VYPSNPITLTVSPARPADAKPARPVGKR